MLNNKTIAVVVPAYNEERQIGRVIETMPEFVDRIIVVNDYSRDKTAEIVQEHITAAGEHRVVIKDVLNDLQETTYSKADFLVQERMKQNISEIMMITTLI